MAGIQGIGGIPEPAPERPAGVRDRKRDDVRAASAQDGVSISAEAKEAASAGRMVQIARESEDIRPERVEAARQNLENGNHKETNVLREVARNLLKYL